MKNFKIRKNDMFEMICQDVEFMESKELGKVNNSDLHLESIYTYSPNNVLACNVTHPVWIYSISCRKTSGSNSSIIIVWCVCTDG